jgi:hypothetical protein
MDFGLGGDWKLDGCRKFTNVRLIWERKSKSGEIPNLIANRER